MLVPRSANSCSIPAWAVHHSGDPGTGKEMAVICFPHATTVVGGGGGEGCGGGEVGGVSHGGQVAGGAVIGETGGAMGLIGGTNGGVGGTIGGAIGGDPPVIDGGHAITTIGPSAACAASTDGYAVTVVPGVKNCCGQEAG
jgi:hypothetical protein